jgi:hypothetical protein
LELVAFCPEILKDEYGHVFSVMVPSGEVTERIWLEALSDKVENMLCKFRNPGKIAAWVCRALDCVHTDDPDHLGYIIIERRLQFKRSSRVSVSIARLKYSPPPPFRDLFLQKLSASIDPPPHPPALQITSKKVKEQTIV